VKKNTPTKRKKASKSSVKDLSPRKGVRVKGGMFNLGDIVGSIAKSVVPTVVLASPATPSRHQ
jgi:hypothetical protein